MRGSDLGARYDLVDVKTLKKIIFKFIFVFGCVGSSLPLGFFSSCCERGLLFSAVCGLLPSMTSLVDTGSRVCSLSCCGSWALEHRLSSYGHGLSGSLACGIFLDRESNLCLLYWQADSLPLRHQGGCHRVLRERDLTCLITHIMYSLPLCK